MLHAEKSLLRVCTDVCMDRCAYELMCQQINPNPIWPKPTLTWTNSDPNLTWTMTTLWTHLADPLIWTNSWRDWCLQNVPQALSPGSSPSGDTTRANRWVTSHTASNTLFSSQSVFQLRSTHGKRLICVKWSHKRKLARRWLWKMISVITLGISCINSGYLGEPG